MFSDYANSYIKYVEDFTIAVTDVETRLIDLAKDETLFTHKPVFLLGQIDNMTYSASPTYGRALASKAMTHILVGHNIAYDLLYAPSVFNNTFAIWDTMLAEYLLTGQAEIMPSLDSLAEKYGIEGKNKEVSEAIKSGVCPSTIRRPDLYDYLKQDIAVTERVFTAQRERFVLASPQFRRMFVNQMLFRINTLRASMNGMRVDNAVVTKVAEKLTEEVAELEKILIEEMKIRSLCDEYDWNPASVKDLMTFLNGGVVTLITTVPAGTYKTGPKAGTTKYKKEKTEETIFPSSPSVVTSTDEKSLKGLRSTYLLEFIDTLLEYRDKSKTLKTYLTGYVDFAKHDGYIHPTFNHGLTPTGRLTCSKPNLQNIKA